MKECPECHGSMIVSVDIIDENRNRYFTDKDLVYTRIVTYTCPLCNYTEDVEVK